MGSGLPKNRIIVAVTGASGSIYGELLVRALLRAEQRTYVVLSKTAKQVVATEVPNGLLHALSGSNLKQRFESNDEIVTVAKKSGVSSSELKNLRAFDVSDFYAPVASGSEGATHMVICPSSMGTLGRIAHGMSTNLIERAADVMLKEKRSLLIVPRETPFNTIHLQNMLVLAQAGAHIIPAMPAFYQKPQSIDELVEFVVERVLDNLKIEGLDFKKSVRWNPRLL